MVSLMLQVVCRATLNIWRVLHYNRNHLVSSYESLGLISWKAWPVRKDELAVIGVLSLVLCLISLTTSYKESLIKIRKAIQKTAVYLVKLLFFLPVITAFK